MRLLYVKQPSFQGQALNRSGGQTAYYGGIDQYGLGTSGELVKKGRAGPVEREDAYAWVVYACGELIGNDPAYAVVAEGGAEADYG